MRTLTFLLLAVFTYLLYEGLSTPRGEAGNILDFLTSHPLPNETWAQGFLLSVPLLLFIFVLISASKNSKLKTSNKIMRHDLDRFQAALGLLGAGQSNVSVSEEYLAGETDPATELQALETALAESEQRADRTEASRKVAGGYLEKLGALRTRQSALRMRLETSRAETRAVEEETRKLRELRDELQESLRQLEEESEGDLAEKVGALEESLGELEEKLRSAQKQSERLTALKARLTDLKTRLTPLTDGKTGAEALYGEVDRLLDEMKDQLETLDQNANSETFEEDVDDLETKKDEVVELLETAETQFRRLATLREEIAKKLAPKPEVPPTPPA